MNNSPNVLGLGDGSGFENGRAELTRYVFTQLNPALRNPGLAGFVVFLDMNANGRRDSGEPSAVTEAKGEYAFTNLQPGNYIVTQESPSGWLQTEPPDGVRILTLGSGDVRTGVDFGNRRPTIEETGEISRSVVQDNNVVLGNVIVFSRTETATGFGTQRNASRTPTRKGSIRFHTSRRAITQSHTKCRRDISPSRLLLGFIRLPSSADRLWEMSISLTAYHPRKNKGLLVEPCLTTRITTELGRRVG